DSLFLAGHRGRCRDGEADGVLVATTLRLQRRIEAERLMNGGFPNGSGRASYSPTMDGHQPPPQRRNAMSKFVRTAVLSALVALGAIGATSAHAIAGGGSVYLGFGSGHGGVGFH